MSTETPTPPAAPAPGRWRRFFLQSTLGIGLATVLVTVPLIFLVPKQAGWVVALLVLCAYPVLDAPRNAGRWSWFLGAIGSTVMWLAVMGVLIGVADSRERLGEGGMVFMLPMMIFPPVLLISGLVRLERHFRGRPRESGVRIATVWGGVVCLLMVGGPIVLNLIPFVTEKITGNSARNMTYGGSDAEVVEADPQHLSVRLSTRTESYGLTPQTEFSFLGPGPRPTDNPAGPAWLKPGQKVHVYYVIRDRVPQATSISIWIDRKGCAGDLRWTAMADPAEGASLTGSTWQSWRGPEKTEPGSDQPMRIEFLTGGRLAYTYANNPAARNTDDVAWRQKGDAVLIQMNDCYAVYEAKLDGDRMAGEFSNEMGYRQPWTARRMAEH